MVAILAAGVLRPRWALLRTELLICLQRIGRNSPERKEVLGNLAQTPNMTKRVNEYISTEEANEIGLASLNGPAD
jgi:hypothetical protein